jgi:hypothetical protein
MQFAHLRSIFLSFTACGSRRSLSKARFALQLLLVALLLLPVAASAQADNTITTADTVGVKVYFRQGSSTLQPAFRDNSVRLDEFMRRVSEMHADSTARLNSIDIVAYASPEGSFTLNRKLARKRAENISAYLRGNMPFLSGSLFNVQPKGIDWNGLAAMVEASDMRYRSEVLNILRNVPETTYRNGRLVDSRLKRLMDLRGGRPYNYMLTHFFPELRAAGAYVVCDFVRIAQPAIPINKPNEPNEANGANEANEANEVDAAIPVANELPERDYDRWAIKSNALYLAAGVTNIGGEYAFHPHWSVDLPLVYSPYTIARRYRMRFLYIQPEARYWLDRPMKGHFFGVHLHAGVFNVSLDNKNRYQSEKGFHGAGISYGYAMPLSRRWSMEFTVGVGYAFTKYCTYYNVPNGIRYEKDIPYHYWGLTKLGLNFVYRFGDKCGKTKSGKEARL